MSDTTVQVRYAATSPCASDGVVEVGGRRIERVRAITISSDISRPSTATIELSATQGLDVTLPAVVTVNVTAYPGYDVLATPQPDGTILYRVVDLHGRPAAWIEKARV